MRPGVCLLALVVFARPSLADEPPTEKKDAPELSSVITGSRSERRLSEEPVATAVIDRRELRQSGATDLPKLLENQPGVQVERNYTGSGVRLEGFDPEHVLVLVDGERLSGTLVGTLDISQLRIDDIEQVEIVKGAGSALYGSDAMGGVVNLVSRGCGGNEYEARAVMSSLLQADVTASASHSFDDKGCLRLSGDFRRTPPLTLGVTPPATGVDGTLGGHLSGRGVWEVTPALRLTLLTRFGANDSAGVDNGVGGALFDRRTRVNTLDVTLRTELSLGAAGSLRLSLRQSYDEEQLLQDQRGSNELDRYQVVAAQLWQASLQYDKTFIERHRFVAGLEGSREGLTSQILNGGRSSRFRGAVYLQDAWRVTDAAPLRLVPSVRVDADSQFGVYPSPRFALRWDPFSFLTLHGSAGAGFRAPGFQQLSILFSNPSVGYRVNGNPALKPESSTNEQLGIEWRPREEFAVTLDLYNNDVNNLIAAQSLPRTGAGPTIYSYVNITRAVTRGGEVGVGLRPAKGLRIDLSYDYLYAQDLTEARPLEGRAPHQVSVRLGYRHQPLELEGSVRAGWMSARPFYDTDTGGADVLRLSPAYVTLDIRVSKTFLMGLGVVAGVDNALNAGNANDLPLPPRNFYGGLQARF